MAIMTVTGTPFLGVLGDLEDVFISISDQ
jgi:hypothetical protein